MTMATTDDRDSRQPTPPRPQASRSGSRVKVAASGRDEPKILDLRTHEAANVSPRQLADYWGRDIETIHKWIKKGSLVARKVGGLWVVSTQVAREFESWPE